MGRISKTFALLLTLIIAMPCLTLLIVKPPNAQALTPVEDTWVSKAEMATARSHLSVATANQKIYAIGGGGPIGTNEEYDPVTDTWTTKASMPVPQQSFAIAVYQGKLYCLGGLSGPGESSLNQVYDIATNTWETKASMPTGRYGLQANVVNGKIYCTGGTRLLGYNQGAEQQTVTEVYDPTTDIWTTKSSMPSSNGYVSAIVDNRIYIVGPEQTQIYNPSTDTWNTGSPPPKELAWETANGISSAVAATTGVMAPKRIYVYDGSTLQIYDPQADSWTNGTAPPTSRQYLGIGVMDDRLYFIGGMSYPIPELGHYYVFHATNEQYTPFGFGTTSKPSPTVHEYSWLVIVPLLVSVFAVTVLVRHRKTANLSK